MSYFLTNDIQHTLEYNSGGISHIYLLDIRHFVSYTFKDDKRYDQCLVDAISAIGQYVELSTVAESNFTESQSNGIYKQELTSFVRSVEGQKLSDLLVANAGKYLIVFKTYQDRYFTFASDGGASLSFSQQAGQSGNASGYALTISKNSLYPLFEVSPQFNNQDALATENSDVLVLENNEKIILV